MNWYFSEKQLLAFQTSKNKNWKVLQKKLRFKNIYNVENSILFVKLELQWSLSIPKCVCVWTTWQKSNFLLKLYVLTKIKHFVLASYLQDTGKNMKLKVFSTLSISLMTILIREWRNEREKFFVKCFLIIVFDFVQVRYV